MPDRGKLDFGRRADFVAINAQTRAIELTVSGGKLSHLCGEAAYRFVGRLNLMEMAAE
jgi:alpha-D-ribose 1-methylphosphonate 5-triphosphate diphosphatase